MIIEDFGGRKFVFAIVTMVCALLLAITGQITFDQFMTLMIWALGIFSVSNAITHLNDK